MQCNRALALGWTTVALAMLSVCSGCIPPTPPATSVLAGTWELTTETTSNLSQVFLTFDADGVLTKITYQINNITIDANAPVADTDVDGDQVEIVAGFAGNHLTLTGTLNADRTVIVGTTFIQITLGTVTVTIDNGPATLTKQ